MKKMRFLLLGLAIAAIAVSCSKDEEDSVSGNKYETTYAKMSGNYLGLAINVEYKTKADLQENEMYEVIEFKADGKFYVDGSNEGTWTQDGANVTVTSDGESVTGKIDGNLLIITLSETDEYGTISVEMHYTKM